MTVQPCHDGNPYGNPELVYPGQSGSWTWVPGPTTATDGSRVWGPKMRATRGTKGEIIVVLEE